MFYKEYFSIKEDYSPCMSKDAINRKPETWLQFYPHDTFVDFLTNILERLDGGNQSVWLTGAYGTGKSHAALVLQKLFMDDEKLVDKWLFEKRKELIPDHIAQAIKLQRTNKVLAVFDSGTTGINTPDQLLVRIERAIVTALVNDEYKIPAMGALDEIIARISREDEFFFVERDKLQDKLSHLTPEIKTVEVLRDKLKDPDLTSGLIHDSMIVLQAMNIFINLSTDNLLKWIYLILEENKISKLLFIWDEFSDYINKNSSELKTFEELAQASQEGLFFFIPVTHMDLNAYVANGSDSAKKANDRFKFKKLDMPTNTALLLAADAFNITNKEWQSEKDSLWHGIKGLVENYMIPAKCGARAEDFKEILPIHPMSAFVLKFLSTAVGSNQRSMFNYLKGDVGDSEFQNFIAHGGPEVKGLQYLTVDYLWTYFIDRDDLGTEKEVLNTKAEYLRKSTSLDESEIRIFKAVLLYSLLSKMGNNHDLLQPTIDNIVRAFEGDGELVGVEGIIRELSKKHCFSIVNNRCEMFRESVGGEELEKAKKRIEPQFDSLILRDKTLPRLETKIKMLKDKQRYIVRVSSVEKCKPGLINNKDWFSSTGNKVLIQFILARDPQEQLQIPDRVKYLVENLKGHRIVFITMPNLNFCASNADMWKEYVEQCAQKELTTDQGSKTLHASQLTQMEDAWLNNVNAQLQCLRGYKPNINGAPFVEDLSWGQLNTYLNAFVKESFGCYVDDLSGYNMTAIGAPNGLKKWALVGLSDPASAPSGAWRSVLSIFERNRIINSPEWFAQHNTHALSQMHAFCKKKLANTVGHGENCSIRKIYIDLQRPPFGLLCMPFSAFILGFVLKDWLTSSRQLQWTNGSLSKKLDIDTLAEIIEQVVKDDGNNKIKDEKLICRLSKEEKIFVEQSSTIFGIPQQPNGTVENTLIEIASRIEIISERVPLWVLPEYIKSRNEDYADVLCEIIDSLCIANTISAKSDTEERTNRVKSIGEHLLKTDGLAQVLARYIKRDTFDDAFRMYVDSSKPELKELAIAIKDTSGQYCTVLKKQFASTAGWLWKRQDADAELNSVVLQYKIIREVQGILGNTSYIPFEAAIARIKHAINVDNKISLALLINNYPELDRFLQIIDCEKIGEGLKDLSEILVHQIELLKKLFFDPIPKEQINILKRLFGTTLASQSESELTIIYKNLSSGASYTEEEFKRHAAVEIEKYLKDSIAQQIIELWKSQTKTDSPNAWSNQHGLPVDILFKDPKQARSITEVVSNPVNFPPELLKKIKHEIKQGVIAFAAENQEKLSKLFLARVLPERYQKLDIDAHELSKFFIEKLGNRPNDWFDSPDYSGEVENFIRERYQSHYKEKATLKVKALAEADAKNLLIQLVNKIPDVGLNILE